MNFYLLLCEARRDDKIPLTVTERHRGCIIVNCSVCGVRGVMPLIKSGKLPVEIKVKCVAYLDDIEQAFTIFLASRRVQDAVKSNGLTGLEFYPPVGFVRGTREEGVDEMIRKCREELQYQVMHVTGRGGSIAKTSGAGLEDWCLTCGWESWFPPKNGIYVDERQWDGSDFFRVDEFNPMLISERAVQALTDARLSNFYALPAEEFRPPTLT